MLSSELLRLLANRFSVKSISNALLELFVT